LLAVSSTAGVVPAACLPAGAVPGRALAHRLAVFRFVDAQVAAAEILAVQRLNGGIGVLRAHLHKAKAAGTAGLTVAHQADRIHFAISCEQVADFVFSGSKRQVANVDGLHLVHSLSIHAAPKIGISAKGSWWYVRQASAKERWKARCTRGIETSL